MQDTGFGPLVGHGEEWLGVCCAFLTWDMCCARCKSISFWHAGGPITIRAAGCRPPVVSQFPSPAQVCNLPSSHPHPPHIPTHPHTPTGSRRCSPTCPRCTCRTSTSRPPPPRQVRNICGERARTRELMLTCMRLRTHACTLTDPDHGMDRRRAPAHRRHLRRRARRHRCPLLHPHLLRAGLSCGVGRTPA